VEHVPLRFKRLSPDAKVPGYQTPLSAGMDLSACLDAPMVLEPGDIRLVPCGFAMAIPAGFEAQVRPRSGLAVKFGISMPNTPGDYRGELMVLLVNLGSVSFDVRRGERIAQLVVQAVARARLVEVDTVGPTKRGAGGFGSTGIVVPVPADPRRVPPVKKASKVSAGRRKRNGRPVGVR